MTMKLLNLNSKLSSYSRDDVSMRALINWKGLLKKALKINQISIKELLTNDLRKSK